MSWQPIETAPKALTPILGYRGDFPELCRVAVIAWYEGHWIGSALSLVMERPTHWQPLPEPPALDKQQPSVIGHEFF